MKRLFIESEIFRKQIDDLINRNKDHSLLQTIQNEILKNPEKGNLIPGLGGLRKIRIKDSFRGKGKRGGLRVTYLDLSMREKTYLIWVYGKNESEDISSEEKELIRHLVENLKKEGNI